MVMNAALVFKGVGMLMDTALAYSASGQDCHVFACYFCPYSIVSSLK